MPNRDNRYMTTFTMTVSGDDYVFTRQRPPGHADHTRSTWDVRRVRGYLRPHRASVYKL
jgi:hypothetical protein